MQKKLTQRFEVASYNRQVCSLKSPLIGYVRYSEVPVIRILQRRWGKNLFFCKCGKSSGGTTYALQNGQSLFSWNHELMQSLWNLCPQGLSVIKIDLKL